MKAPSRLNAMKNVITGYYPGFPTDAQPLLMAMATVADGTGIFVENIFENRYHHVHELSRLGAKIKVEGRMAVVEGVKGLSGTKVKASDLRGGAALVVAALGASGDSIIQRVYHIDRGYYHLEEKLQTLGADIERHWQD
jgi:UDP-N-acetylglucosamine 1-carboxyvinyltransferase